MGDDSPGNRLEAGTVIDGFRLKEHLHQGGMAKLWAGELAAFLPTVPKR